MLSSCQLSHGSREASSVTNCFTLALAALATMISFSQISDAVTGPGERLSVGGSWVVADVSFFGLQRARDIALSTTHAMILFENSTIISYGSNASGQQNVPSYLGDLNGLDVEVMRVVAGPGTSIALLSNGTAVFWGDTDIIPPGPVHDVIDVGAGLDFTMVLFSNGSVSTWGYMPPPPKEVQGRLRSISAMTGCKMNTALELYPIGLAVLANGSAVAWASMWHKDAVLPSFENLNVRRLEGGFLKVEARLSNGSIHKQKFRSIISTLGDSGSPISIELVEPQGTTTRDRCLATEQSQFRLCLAGNGMVYSEGGWFIQPSSPSLPRDRTAVRAVPGYSKLWVLLDDGKVVEYSGRQPGSRPVTVSPNDEIITDIVGHNDTVMAITKSGSVVHLSQEVTVPAAAVNNTAGLAFVAYTPFSGNGTYFAILRNTSGVIGWGAAADWVDPPSANVTHVVTDGGTALALLNNGTVVAWRRTTSYSDVPQILKSGVVDIYVAGQASSSYETYVGATLQDGRVLLVTIAYDFRTGIEGARMDAAVLNLPQVQSVQVCEEVLEANPVNGSSFTINRLFSVLSNGSTLVTELRNPTQWIEKVFADGAATSFSCFGSLSVAVIRDVTRQVGNSDPAGPVKSTSGSGGQSSAAGGSGTTKATRTTLTISGTLIQENFVPPSAFNGVRDVAASNTTAYAVLHKGSVVAWGTDLNGTITDMPPQLGDDVPVIQVVTGDGCTMALLKNGTCIPWGDKCSVVLPVHNVTDMTVNAKYSMLLLSNGSVHAYYPGGMSYDPFKLIGSTDMTSSTQATIRGLSAVHHSGGVVEAVALLTNGSAVSRFAFRDRRNTNFSGMEIEAIHATDRHMLVKLKNGTVLSKVYVLSKDYRLYNETSDFDSMLGNATFYEQLQWHGCVDAAKKYYEENKYEMPFGFPLPQGWHCHFGSFKQLPWHDNITNIAATNDMAFLTDALGNTFVYKVSSTSGVDAELQHDIVPSSAARSVRKVAVQDTPTGRYALYVLESDALIATGIFETLAYVPSVSRETTATVATGINHIVSLTTDGQVFAYGSNVYQQVAVPRAAGASCAQIAAGRHHSLALTNSGNVLAWGDNPQGQVTVPNITNFNTAQIAAGGDSSFAVLKNSGRVVVWGLLSSATVPAPPTANVSHVAVLGTTAAAVFNNGTVIFWGLFGYYPVPRQAKTDVTRLFASRSFQFVPIKRNGTIVIWEVPDVDLSGTSEGSRYSLLAVVNDFPDAAKACVYGPPGSRTNYFLYVLLGNGTLLVSNTLSVAFSDALTWRQHPDSDSKSFIDVLCGETFTILLHTDLPVGVSGPVSGPADLPPAGSEGSGLTERSAGHAAAMSTSGGTAPKLRAGGIAGVAVACAALLVLVGVCCAVYIKRSSIRSARTHSGAKAGGATKALKYASTEDVCIDASAPGVVVVLTPDHGGDNGVQTDYVSGYNSDRSLGAGQHLHIPGLNDGEVFMRATAMSYAWGVAPGNEAAVEAGVNDWQLDKAAQGLSATASNGTGSSGSASPCDASPCLPIIELNKEDIRQQIVLQQDGLLGRGATALVFKCQWPSRFGPRAVLAAKVLKDGYEADPSLLESFKYEATTLSAAVHPNIVRLYGYCLDPPNVCLILELLPCSLKDLLYKDSLAATTQTITKRQKNLFQLNPHQ